MMHNTRRMRADRDEDILSAMLTAILSFLMDFDAKRTAIERFQLGGKTALLQRGTTRTWPPSYSGRVPRWSEKDLRRFMASRAPVRRGLCAMDGDPHDLQGLKESRIGSSPALRYRPMREARPGQLTLYPTSGRPNQ